MSAARADRGLLRLPVSLLLLQLFRHRVLQRGLVSCAMTRMCGGEPTLAGGLSTAASRIPVIAVGRFWRPASVWCCGSLKTARTRSAGSSRLVGRGLDGDDLFGGAHFGVEQRNPFSALKESTVLLKKTWGEQLMSGFGFARSFRCCPFPRS